MKPPLYTVWTPTMHDRLRELAAPDDAPTYQEIADQMSKEFKVKLTKNACIGAARRLGVSKKPVFAYLVTHPSEPIDPMPRFASSEMPKLAPPGPRQGLLTLMELNAKKCKWPIGNSAPYLFCGKPLERRSYCKEHCAIAYGRDKHAPRT